MVNLGLHIQKNILYHMDRRLIAPAVATLSAHVHYRDRIYIIKDVLLKLVEYGELNQTALMSFCGLNLSKHRSIIEQMETRGLIIRETTTMGRKKSISIFRPTAKGMEFCRDILEPYEKVFPRKTVIEESSGEYSKRREEESIGV
jgi:predicted transcriptional regulator